MNNVREWVRTLRRRHGSEFVNHEAIRRLSWVHESINERVALSARLAAVTVDGCYGVIVQSMDCDCTQARHEFTRRSDGVFAEQKRERDAQQDAEGPRYVSYVRPDDVRDGYHRTSDRALAAYEDGHMSSVTWADLG